MLAYTGSGPVGLLDTIARAGRQALLAAFYQKYYHHFRCRPETYGGRVHAQRHDRYGFEIPELLTESVILSVRDHETDYLSTAYVEGSPVHPAYPSGHSVIAGACGTVLKTWFPDPDWEESDLDYLVVTHRDDQLGTGTTDIEVPDGHSGLHQEIDKLISNVGLARMFAGIHYYSDHYHGVKLGEQVAVGLLADIFGRTFTGSEENDLTFKPYLRYDDDPVSIEPGEADTLDEMCEAAVDRDPVPTG